MIKIDEEKCIGCGACESMCEEGFEIVGGVAKLKNKNAEGINEVIDVCPVSAISK